MTENKKIKVAIVGSGRGSSKTFKQQMGILEELQTYRNIGTIEEFKALKEKNEPKKPIERFTGSEWVCECPACRGITATPQEQIVESIQYCAWCGQKLDWSEEGGKK